MDSNGLSDEQYGKALYAAIMETVYQWKYDNVPEYEWAIVLHPDEYYKLRYYTNKCLSMSPMSYKVKIKEHQPDAYIAGVPIYVRTGRVGQIKAE